MKTGLHDRLRPPQRDRVASDTERMTGSISNQQPSTIRGEAHEFVEPADSFATPGCWFRRSASQPMRNVALAEVLRRRHAGRVAVALCAPAEHRMIWTRWDAIRPAFDEDALVDLPAEHVLAVHADAVAAGLREMYGLCVARDGRVVCDLEYQTWSILASLVERYEAPPIVVELHPGGGMHNCMSLVAGRGWHGPVVDLNRGGGMHIHDAGGLRSVRDGWRRAARWGCDEVADEIARAAGLATRGHPASAVLRDFAGDVATELCAGRRAHWLNGMLDTSGYGGGVRAELFEWFPELATPNDPGDDGLEAEVYRHWFLVTSSERPLKHRYLERWSPLTQPSA
jgi:hypothetical protein